MLNVSEYKQWRSLGIDRYCQGKSRIHGKAASQLVDLWFYLRFQCHCPGLGLTCLSIRPKPVSSRWRFLRITAPASLRMHFDRVDLNLSVSASEHNHAIERCLGYDGTCRQQQLNYLRWKSIPLLPHDGRILLQR